MHDKNGTPLSVGNRVTLECVILETTSSDDFCNLKIETVEPMHPSDRRDSQWVNARQVVKVPVQELR